MNGTAVPGRFSMSSEAEHLGRLRQWLRGVLCLFESIGLLYFDRRRAAAEVAGIFRVANAALTLAT